MWWRLSLPLHPVLEESLLWKLESLGLHRLAVQHAPESPDQRMLLAWLPASEWPKDQRDQLLNSLRPMAETFGLELAQPIWEELAEEDWSLSWKKHWQPDPVGERLLILPAWLDVPKEHQHRLVLKMDPGSAFGTGSHPTTRLCLEALEAMSLRDQTVADLGCGSGILGLAAVALGAREVLAADTDSLAVRATTDNALLNGLEAKQLRVSYGSIDKIESMLDGEAVDLLLCNILAPVIEALAPQFASVLKSTGRGLLSGLLVDQAHRLIQVLAEYGWRARPIAEQGRWGLLEIKSLPR
ncbi:MAG: 50S ribosomal protein L11 methyltransferase [Propionibacteriaceae bacterium]|nr:50S ribosomal protein L11 methyltransferase [Propionibacteriaceae bacterium]